MSPTSLLAKTVYRCYYELLAMTNKPTIALGDAPVGFRGRIQALSSAIGSLGLSGSELERRLLELGFVEGAMVELLHEGLFGRDPIAVRVAHTTVALRRREAMAILVNAEAPA